jgi:hypothetical protein
MVKAKWRMELFMEVVVVQDANVPVQHIPRLV